MGMRRREASAVKAAPLMRAGRRSGAGRRGDGGRSLIGVGQMAALNCLSVKALHVYQDYHLLEPAYVDPDSGYRYYSVDQCSRLDAVVQMRALGFTLAEIAALLEGDAAALRQAIQRRIDELEEKRSELLLSMAAARSLLDVCDAFDEPVREGVIEEVLLPSRWAFVFDIDPVGPDDVDNLNWEMAVRSVRRQLSELGKPMSLFRNISGIIAEENLRNGSFVTNQAVVLIDEETAANPLATDGMAVRRIPGGRHLCMYHEKALRSDGSSVEYADIPRMMAYARDHGLEIAGDYLGETLAATPLFSYEGRDSFFRMLLPVR